MAEAEEQLKEKKVHRRKTKEATGPDLLLLHTDVRLLVQSEILPTGE